MRDSGPGWGCHEDKEWTGNRVRKTGKTIGGRKCEGESRRRDAMEDPSLVYPSCPSARHPPIYPSAYPHPSIYLSTLYAPTHTLSAHSYLATYPPVHPPAPSIFPPTGMPYPPNHTSTCPFIDLPNPPPHLLTDLPNSTPAQVMYLIEEAQPRAGLSL